MKYFGTAAWILFFFLVPPHVLGGCDGTSELADSRAQPEKIGTVEGVNGDNLFLDGRVYISGQPDESALADLKDLGVTVVVNARTPAEFEDREEVPFDEESVVRDLGMDYVSIPLGGDEHPYEPGAVQRLTEVLASTDGPVLIHCTLGGRAAYLWLAYLVQEEGLPLDQAMARGEAMMLKPHPIGRLLDRPTTLVFSQ